MVCSSIWSLTYMFKNNNDPHITYFLIESFLSLAWTYQGIKGEHSLVCAKRLLWNNLKLCSNSIQMIHSGKYKHSVPSKLAAKLLLLCSLVHPPLHIPIWFTIQSASEWSLNTTGFDLHKTNYIQTEYISYPLHYVHNTQLDVIFYRIRTSYTIGFVTRCIMLLILWNCGSSSSCSSRSNSFIPSRIQEYKTVCLTNKTTSRVIKAIVMWFLWWPQEMPLGLSSWHPLL